MKTIRSKDDIEKAARLFEIIEKRREFEAEEKALKEHFKAMGEVAIKANDILITLTDKERTNLDRKSLAAFLGIDKLSEFENTTHYMQVDVKKVV